MRFNFNISTPTPLCHLHAYKPYNPRRIQVTLLAFIIFNIKLTIRDVAFFNHPLG